MKYHKIQSVFKREKLENGKYGKLIFGEWSTPEIEFTAGLDWEWTEKIDGMNIRVEYDPEEDSVSIGGREDNSDIPAKLVNYLVHTLYGSIPKVSKICLFGEGVGENIRSSEKYLFTGFTHDFILFDVLVDDRWWLNRENVEDVAKKLLLRTAPVVGHGTLLEAVDKIKSSNMKSQFGDFEAEGLVMRPSVQLFSRSGDRLIAKVKVKDF